MEGLSKDWQGCGIFRSSLGNVESLKISMNSLLNFAMAATLGKRKRQSTETIRNTRAASEESSEIQNEDVQDVFRRHFEAHFKPLSTVKKTVNIVEEAIADGDGEESEWGGISEPEGILED